MHDQRVNVHLIALPRVAPGVNGGNPKGNKREADHGGWNKPQPLDRPRTGDKEPAKVPEELKGPKLRTSERKPMCWHHKLSKGCNNSHKKMAGCKFWIPHMHEMFASEGMVQQLATPMGLRDQRSRPP